MLDRFIYNCFAKLDDAVSFVETGVIKLLNGAGIPELNF